MPRTVPEAAAETTAQAVAKAAAVQSPAGYLKSSVLAGVYVGMAVVLLVSVSAPLAAAGSAATRLVQGAVFGLALTLVVFPGAELFTGNVMVMAHGVSRRATAWRSVGLVGALSLLGRSEEHTSELQSRQYLVCRLLLEKKKTNKYATVYC